MNDMNLRAGGLAAMKTAICPGSFDPVTVGHMDLVSRAALLFDRVVVAVCVNAGKSPMFSLEERLEMVRGAVACVPNAEARCFSGLLADLAAEEHACALVKGVRSAGDLDWEMQMAEINRSLLPGLETVLLPARGPQSHISSTMARELLRYGRTDKLTDYIPAGAAAVLARIREGK